MRKILGASVMLTIIAFAACANRSTRTGQDTKEPELTIENNNKTNETKKMGTILLTKADFFKKSSKL
jgi:hypothetical protein